jgi:pilus assembly protein CpaB
VGAYNLPGNVGQNADELKGKFAAADLVRGDYILTSKLTDNPYEENEYLYKLDGTKGAISVSIKSFALGLSGKLKSGDIVSIIASDYGEMRETKIPPELQYVEVLAVTNAKGMDESVQVKGEKNNDEKQLPSTVTLLANTTQAKILADLEAKSKIHMALVYRGKS